MATTPPEQLSIIHDKRSFICFKKTTFSNYSTKDVVKALCTKMGQQNIQVAQHWAAELVCSGQIDLFIETILDFYVSTIGTANSKIPAYLLQRISELRGHTSTLSKIDPLQVRNDTIIRRHVCEIVDVLCSSAQKKLLPKPTIGTEDFHMDNVSRRKKTTG